MDLPGVDLLMALVQRLEMDGKKRMAEKREAMVDRAITEQQLAKVGVPMEPKG
jgi:hypothetical protein